MPLLASKTLSAIIGAGFFPKEMTAVGPYDEAPFIASAGPTINKTTKPGANRVLACEFAPLGDQDPKAAAQASINEVVSQLHAKIARTDDKAIGKAQAYFADLRYTNPAGAALSIQIAAFPIDEIVYRFTLSGIESKAAEMRVALEGMVKVLAT